MKNLSITLLILSSLMFGTNVYGQSKNRTKTIKSERRIKYVRPNVKIKKVKVVTVKSVKRRKNKAKYNKRYNPKPKYSLPYRSNEWKYRKHLHGPRYLIGHRYPTLPRSAVRIVRNGRVEFYARNAFFRPIYKRGHTHFLVVSKTY